MCFYGFTSALVRLKEDFGIGPDCLSHICAQIFGELCSVICFTV